jgi:hypothetical protein
LIPRKKTSIPIVIQIDLRQTLRSNVASQTKVPKALQRLDDDVQDPRQKGGSQYCHQGVDGYV